MGIVALPAGTAIKQPPTVPEFAPSTTTIVLAGVKATFAEGAAPCNVEIVSASKPATQIQTLDTSLGVTWHRPTRTVCHTLRRAAPIVLRLCRPPHCTETIADPRILLYRYGYVCQLKRTRTRR